MIEEVSPGLMANAVGLLMVATRSVVTAFDGADCDRVRLGSREPHADVMTVRRTAMAAKRIKNRPNINRSPDLRCDFVEQTSLRGYEIDLQNPSSARQETLGRRIGGVPAQAGPARYNSGGRPPRRLGTA